MENNLKFCNKDEFDKNFNLAFVEQNVEPPSNRLILKHYLSSLIIYGIALIVFQMTPFYTKTFVDVKNINILLNALYAIYLIFAPFFLFTLKPKTIYKSHSIDVVKYFYNHLSLKGFQKDFNAIEFINWLKPNYYEKQSMMIFFIKFLFAPQLFCWAYNHLHTFLAYFEKFIKLNNIYFDAGLKDFIAQNKIKFILAYRNVVYCTLYQFLFLVDCIIFFIGYFTECVFLNNKIKTVDTSFLGIFVCIMCYPPFNYIFHSFIPWKHNDMAFKFVSSEISFINWIFYIIAICLIFFYVSASVALFTKASNLTNRGIVSHFPYNIIRHPAYISKISLWWLASFCVIKNLIDTQMYSKVILFIITAIIWTFIYFLRALTEERHLMLDPDYREYAEKVKYRFIPFVF